MWNYRNLSSNSSPMAEILGRCSSKSNIRLVVYHLSENHVECATVPNADMFNLGSTARLIKNDSHHNHAILAFDLGTNEVYKIEDVPELPVASAVLLCVVTELLNGAVQPRENQYGIPKAACTQSVKKVFERAADGRFMSKSEPQPSITPSVEDVFVGDTAAPVVGRRFRLGRH